jgi:hypothetical protein
MTQQEILKATPPAGLSDEALENWYKDMLRDDRGSLVMKDEWAEDTEETQHAAQ